MKKPVHVTFGSLAEGDYFVARGKFHCKETVGCFKIPPNSNGQTYNAFYFDGGSGRWAHFDDLVLVQPYDESIHGQPAGVTLLHNRAPSN